MLAGRIGGLRCGGPLFDLAVAESGDVDHLILCPFPWQGVGRRRKRVKPTSGATRHLLPKEGGRWAGGWSRKAWEVLIESQRQILQEFLYIASRRDAFASRYYRRRCPKVVFKSPVTSHQLLELPNPFIRTFLKNFPPKNYLTHT